MADIKKELNDIKNAVYGKEVRGSIHDGIKKINDEVEISTDLSESAKHQVENIQQQVNQLVVEGDSSVEAAQARVDAEGNTFNTLKERLDTKETQFSSQLAENTTKINELGYIPTLDKNVDNTDKLQSAINYCITNKKKLTLVDGNYLINKQLEVNGDLEIEVIGSVTIKSTAVFDNMINSTGLLAITGKLTLDANGLTKRCIYVNTILPKLDGLIFKNSLSFCVENNNKLASGHAIINNYHAIDCAGGVRIVGDSTTTSVTQINGKTSGTTGTEGNNYFYSNHKYVFISGGDFTGAETTAPNIYLTDNAVIMGGRYHNMYRGATVGRSTKNFTIMGTVAENCTYSGISVDLRETDGSVPDGYGVVSGNVWKNCGYALYGQGKKFSIIGNYSENHQNADGAIRINGGTEVFIDGNSIVYPEGKNPFSISQNSKVTFGKNHVSHIDLGVRVTGGSVAEFSKVRTVTENTVLRLTDDILLVDGTVAGLDLDLPSRTLTNSIGKKWTIVRIDGGANPISVTIANGDGTINGGAGATIPSGKNKIYEVVSIGNGDYIMNV